MGIGYTHFSSLYDSVFDGFKRCNERLEVNNRVVILLTVFMAFFFPFFLDSFLDFGFTNIEGKNGAVQSFYKENNFVQGFPLHSPHFSVPCAYLVLQRLSVSSQT